MIEWMIAILGQIHISITLFSDMISGISRQMVIPHSPSFAPDRLRNFYKQKFSNLKHSSSSYAMISKCSPNCFESCTSAQQVFWRYLCSFFNYHEKCSYFTNKEIQKVEFEATVWHHRWRDNHEKYFLWHNLGRSFHISPEIKDVFNISTFQKWPPFWSRDKLFTGSVTASWICQQDSHEYYQYFWAFDQCSSWTIVGDISILKFDLLCGLVTSSMTSWVRET